MKLEFPKFGGDNRSAWIYKANQYFHYYNTHVNQKILMASYHIEDEVLVWFQDAEEFGVLTSREAFVKALQVRFGLTAYNDPIVPHKVKIKYTISVYKSQFESLSNRPKSLSEKHKLSCFFEWIER